MSTKLAFIMKILVFIFIMCLYCCTAIYSQNLNDQQILKVCFAESGLDFVTLSQDEKTTKKEMIRLITPYKLGCITVCSLKKRLTYEVSMKEHVFDSIEKAQTMLSEDRITEFKSAANKCVAEVNNDECKLMECLKPWDSQLGYIIGI